MKFSSISLITLCGLSFINLYAPNNQQKTQGNNMLTTGQVLDLTKFTKRPDNISHQLIQQAPENADKPARGELVEVHYSGYNIKILNGTYTLTNEFDNSYKRGRPFVFQVGGGQVIKGWDLMIADMKEGERRLVILPPEMAYGSRGAGQAILPNATLIFDMHLVKIR